MRLRTTAGRYAGQVRDYDLPCGLRALKAGTAEPVETPDTHTIPAPPAAAPPAKRKKTR
jgi:hypothetical protein